MGGEEEGGREGGKEWTRSERGRGRTDGVDGWQMKEGVRLFLSALVIVWVALVVVWVVWCWSATGNPNR